MSSIQVKHNTILGHKNNIYHGTTLLLGMLLVSMATSAVHSTPIEQLQVNHISAKTEENSESVFGQKGQVHWYIQGAEATTKLQH